MEKSTTGRKSRNSLPSVPQKKVSFLYPAFSLLVLVATSIYWAFRSANLQFSNSDQLINPLLMQSLKTFKDASYPGQHTLLFKWPIFWLVDLVGLTKASYDFFTVIIVLLTLGLFVLLLRKINGRNEIFGTLVLALAAVLLLVPAQPYSGGLLPVNMAMLSTRNLEYPLFIGSLLLILKKPNLKSWSLWLGVAGFSLLIASDKLFMTLTIGGSLIALIVYGIVKQWNNVTRSINWLLASIVSAVIGSVLLWLISALKITHIVNQASASPYSLVNSAHNFSVGVFYSISGFFTNFGANPAFDGVTIRSVPHLIASRLFSVGGPGYIVNFLVMATGLFAVWTLVKTTLKAKGKRVKNLDLTSFLALSLVFSSVVMFAVFIFSNHEYTVDSRYLTICLFTVFIALAVVSKKWQLKNIKMIVVVLIIGIISGLLMSSKIFNNQAKALVPINDRNSQITQVLKGTSGNILIGNYWRVVPIKLSETKSLNIIPLSGCTTLSNTLTSSNWNKNLENHPFTYLLSLDHGLTNYPACSINTVFSVYGRPNQSYLIAGSISNPKEKLLIYQHGISKNKETVAAKTPSTVLPIDPSALPYTSCDSPTVLNFVAHEDDDLLFMNPQVYTDLEGGYCVRTVYLTAGDAGSGISYWLGRESGVEAAYNYMLGSNNTIWVDRIVKLANNEYTDVANPKGNSKISLIFMHLPDGNLKGQGFATDDFESLQKLNMGQIKNITTVDKQSTYTSSSLISALANIMHIYSPTIINTQSEYISAQFPDHSDHISVSSFVKKAYAQYETNQFANQVKIPIFFYIGYPIRTNPVNVSGSLLSMKINAFIAYARFDPGVCQSVAQCLTSPTYSRYLDRQYTNPN